METIIFGAHDFASLANWYLTRDSAWKPVAFTVEAAYLEETTLEGLPVVPYEEIVQEYPPSVYRAFCPLADNRLRARLYLDLKSKGYELINYVSSRATVFSDVGENCFVLEDNTIQPYVKIGNNIILWSGNQIGHHSEIKDHVFLSSHVAVSGHCTIEAYAWLGANCSLKHHTRIAEGATIGMGSVVIADTEPWAVYAGVPAKKIRSSR